MTSAPRLHRSCVQKGPGRRRVKSRTTTPSREAGTEADTKRHGLKVLGAPFLTGFSTPRSSDTFEQDSETGAYGGPSAGECQADEEVVRRIGAPHQHVHIGRLGSGVAPDVRHGQCDLVESGPFEPVRYGQAFQPRDLGSTNLHRPDD